MNWRIYGRCQGRSLPLGSNSFIFMQFWEKIWPNNRLVHSFGVGAPVWEFLDPPLVSDFIKKGKFHAWNFPKIICVSTNTDVLLNIAYFVWMGWRPHERLSNVWTFVLMERKKRAHVDVPVIPCVMLSVLYYRPFMRRVVQCCCIRSQTLVLIIDVKGDKRRSVFGMQSGAHGTRTRDEPAKQPWSCVHT